MSRHIKSWQLKSITPPSIFMMFQGWQCIDLTSRVVLIITNCSPNVHISHELRIRSRCNCPAEKIRIRIVYTLTWKTFSKQSFYCHFKHWQSIFHSCYIQLLYLFIKKRCIFGCQNPKWEIVWKKEVNFGEVRSIFDWNFVFFCQFCL